MPLTPSDVTEQAKDLHEEAGSEKSRLDKIRRYLRDDPTRRLEGLPSSVPAEIQRLAKLSRVNMLKFIVNSRVQSMYVDGFRTPEEEDHPAWEVWQANRMDARQIGIHRAALAYGAAYVTVTPGTRNPIIRGVSPRKLTAFYAEDDDEWPVYALEQRRKGWRLYDRQAVYTLDDSFVQQGDPQIHDARWQGEQVTPVVRYRETMDLDDDARGIVEPYFPLQDQINVTTFGLLVSQHFSAFKQRFILGWTTEDENAKLKASASSLWTFKEHPDDIEIGELTEADLSGYIESRESTLKHLATVSQTPAHELIGEMVNISADALVAAEASKQRALEENKSVVGESHEQTLGLAAEYGGGTEADPMAFVRWKDTESRALSQLVDALGKAVQMLGIPPQALWDRIADALGASQQEVEIWRALAEEGDTLGRLESLLDRQAASGSGGPA